MVCRVWWAESFPSLASVTLPAHAQAALLALSRTVPLQDALEKAVAQTKVHIGRGFTSRTNPVTPAALEDGLGSKWVF